MTPSLSGKSWAKPALYTSIALLTALLWLYLAGGIFLIGVGGNYNTTHPLTFVQYALHYGGDKRIANWLWVGAGLATALLVVPTALVMRNKKASLHGDARFATSAEVKKAGLLDGLGIIVGKYAGKFLMFGGPQHIMLSAPTRSGKGVSVIIPNLLQWPESCVVLDIKQENWDITSGYRRKYGQRCYLFNPVASDGKTHRYNPLGYVSDDPGTRIDDLQKIANMIFPDLQGTDPIWTATPRSLFLGVCLYLFETPGKPRTIGQVLREMLQDGDGSEYFSNIVKERKSAGIPLSPACVRALNSYITISAENTRGGILSSFRSRLELWMNPIVDAATSANDFDLRDVRKKKMSIYIGITPDNLERMAPLVNLFFQQLIDLNIQQLPAQNPELKYTCLLLMDEFTAIGKVSILSKSISFIAGYGLRMLTIIQSPSQLVDVYGKEAAQTLQTNHALNIVFAPKASELQATRDISEWLGYTTVKSASRSRSTELLRKPNRSESVSDQRRALLLPQEIAALGQDAELIVLENVLPIKAKKARYFADAKFMDRLKEVAPGLAQVGKKLPTKAQLDEAIFGKALSAPVPRLDVEGYARELEGQAPGAAIINHREFKADDLPRIKQMTFDIDFSNIPAPPPAERTIESIEAWVDKLSVEAGFEIS